ncbi:hypothetical protein [Maliponia aquimaris]|uniref:Uncharacterized protein n=1 Tax=Maliponia aquimaris TaxID=1673631 RepID=A0A238K3K2_9RHOB|nr:hypothetical protein [Maliponia aquimaris]SMX37435.1 hypothetical protein MAA8898_01143 [Maliponia aquimaris]
MASLVTSGAPSEEVVAASARAAQKTFSNAIDDPVYAEAVALLVIVSQAGQGDDFASSLRRNGVAVETAPDLIGLLEAVGQRLDAAGRQGGEVSDVGSLARRALLGALYTSFSQELPGLFPEPADLPKAVRKFSSPAGFSELARAFFTRMTAETLAYWLDRTMGAQIGDGRRFQDAHDRNVFDAALSQFSAEATRIIKEFSAGWYAKNAFSNRGDLRERSKAYAAIAFKKINEELQRRVGDDA